MTDNNLFGVVVTIGLALIFDFSNGFHDTANAVSTVVGSKSLSPRLAVIVAAVFNFLPALLGSTGVANTVASIINSNALPRVGADEVPMGVRATLAGLVAATFWNFLTWQIGIPSSSSHALLGGLVGAGLSAAGLDGVTWASAQKAAIAIVASPGVALVVSVIASLILRLLNKCTGLGEDHWLYRGLQIVSTCWLSWSHGSNDGQKTMGVIAATLYAGGYLSASSVKTLRPPTWVIYAANVAIALGTLWGGWRIISTVALSITKISRASGLAANAGAIAAIEGSTALGVPVSTTHAAATSVVGSGLGFWRKVDHWVIIRMVITWITTIPAVMALGFILFKVTLIPGVGFGIVMGAIILALLAWAIYMMVKADDHKKVQEAIKEPSTATTGTATDGTTTGDGTAVSTGTTGSTAGSDGGAGDGTTGATAVAIAKTQETGKEGGEGVTSDTGTTAATTTGTSDDDVPTKGAVTQAVNDNDTNGATGSGTSTVEPEHILLAIDGGTASKTPVATASTGTGNAEPGLSTPQLITAQGTCASATNAAAADGPGPSSAPTTPPMNATESAHIPSNASCVTSSSNPTYEPFASPALSAESRSSSIVDLALHAASASDVPVPVSVANRDDTT